LGPQAEVDRDTRLAEVRANKVIDAYNPNLKHFAKKGGKLILYQS